MQDKMTDLKNVVDAVARVRTAVKDAKESDIAQHITLASTACLEILLAELTRLQSEAGQCVHDLTDEQWWELYVAMDDVTPPSGPFSVTAVAKAARDWFAATQPRKRDE